jgi:4-diphosphocytidyl-2-C-methyl-D-erythritol kinase
MEKKMRKKMELCLKSPAKINLFLDVLRKKTDGYHEIRTIFAELELCDIINFTLTEKDSIKILSNIDSLNNKENLIYKVAFFIKQKYNVKRGVTINLEKKIPISAGLGGGSSNAATTIKALSKLWQLNLTANQQHQIAARFGSDINFFLQGGTCLGENRGEQITPLTSHEINNILLINPGFAISSKTAYQLVEIDRENSDWKILKRAFEPELCFNKLEKCIRTKFKAIDEDLNYLTKNGANKAILSGSGATMIAFCPDNSTAKKLAQHYSKIGYWNYITKTKGVQNEHY